MVNKAVVGLLLGVVVIALLVAGTVGVLVTGAGSNASGTPTPTDVQPTPLPTETATPTVTAASTTVPTTTPSATATAQPTTVAMTTIASDEFQAERIEAAIRTMINERRQERGLETLRSDTEPVKKLNALARSHSEEMADNNTVAYVVDGRNTGDRYRQFDVYGTCKWQAPGGGYVIKPDEPRKTQLEIVGMTMAGRPYSADDERGFNGNETQVAGALVTEWFDGYPDESKFYLEGASQVGVGVHVTLSGEVYATVALC